MVNSPSNLPPEIQASADEQLLAVRTPRLIYKLAAMQKRLPAKGGTTLRSSRYDRLPTAVVPLSPDGAPIPSTPLNRIDIDATVSFYGLYSAINQRVFLQNQDMVLAEVSQLMGLSLRMTEDQLCRDALAASASVYYCTGGTNGDAPTNLSLSDVQTVVAALMSADGNMILESQIGEDRFGTAPVPDAYVAFAHTDLSKPLSNINGFTSKWNYPSAATSKVGAEWGVLQNVRFFLSSQGLIRPLASNLGQSVYSVMVCAMEAYGCVYQDNFSSRIIYLGPEFSDPLMQNVSIGYTMAEVSRVYNDLWISQVLCTL